MLKIMRPLFHPQIQDVTVEGILHALSDPVRFSIYIGIVAAECPQTCTDCLKLSEKNIPKSTLSQHFKSLREAGLIRSERYGVEMRNTPRCVELDTRFPGLLKAIVDAHKVQTAGQTRSTPARKRETVNGSTPKPANRITAKRKRGD
jgi:DNA-binding transcriptional ArsR family regulator